MAKNDEKLEDRRKIVPSLLGEFKSAGHRITESRTVLCQAMREMEIEGLHPDAEELCARAIGGEQNVSTTYRFLQDAVRLGLLRQINLTDGRGRFEYNVELNDNDEIVQKPPHPHVVEMNSGKVHNVEITPMIKAAIDLVAKETKTDKQVRRVDFVVYVD